MNRVGRFDLAFVVSLTAFRWEFLMLVAIKFAECLCDIVSRREHRGVGDRLEQPTAHNFKTLLGVCRTPRCFDTADGILERDQRLSSACAANFLIVHSSARKTSVGRAQE